MILRRIDLSDGGTLSEEDLGRSGGVDPEVLGVAARIVAEVQQRGDEALFEFTERFDRVRLDDLRVSADELEEALTLVGPEFVASISAAAASIEDFHSRQLPNSWFTSAEGGIFLGQKVTPLQRVGIYVPGGRACYPSSVLMNAIPAVVAGVEEIAMVVPPDADGSVNPYTLAAAVEAGVTEIYKVGGAQAIAALAFGTESIRRVDKITGPGNAYVTAAKKLVMGYVGIDMLAGPSEVLILADETAEPAFVAIDMMAQAEHDPKASAYLVTIDADLVDEVEDELEYLLEQSDREEVTRQALTDNGIAVVCPDLEVALDAANTVSPEHLEVMMAEPLELLGSIRNAGAIFLGPWTPESVGDYVAGPNHVLPTGGTARFSSPLSVDDFVKKSSVLSYSRDALEMDARVVMTIAAAEGLDSHARAVALRLGGFEFDVIEGGMGIDDEDGEDR